jgi:PAS domain S-box-containing protein
MKAEEMLQALAYGFPHASIGEPFFKDLAQYLSKALSVDYVFIGELTEEDQKIRSVAFFAKGTLADPVEYPVVGSLCEYVIQPKFCAFTSRVQQQFPDNQALKYYNVESYVGLPLLSTQKKVVGLIYIMHSLAIDHPGEVETFLSIVAGRAAMELERLLQEKQLQAQNQALMEANQQLAYARQALTEANQQLEMRVAERTRELSSSEEELRQSMEQLGATNRTLTEREAYLTSIINQTVIGIALVDEAGHFIFVNEGYCNIVGRTEAQLLTKTISDITYPEDLQNNLVLLDRLRQTGERVDLEKRYIRPDGSLVWCSITISLVQQSEGLPVRTMAVCRDITSRKLTEMALRRTEERFHLLSKATNDAVRDWDLNTNELWWNEGFKTMFGYQAAEIESSIDSWYNRIHPQEQKRVAEGIHRVIDHGGKQWSDEYLFRKADGSYAYILDRAYALHDEEGKPYRMIGSMLDLTERKQANEALTKLTTEYRFLADFIPILVWRTLPDGNADYFNKRWIDYTGLTYEQSINNGWSVIVHPEDYQRTSQEWQHSLATGEKYQIEYRLRKTDGTYRWFLGQGLPLKDEGGNIYKWFGTCTDIHEQKGAEEALQRSQLQEREAKEKVEQQRQFLHSLFSQVPAMLSVLTGPDLVFELANEGLRKVIGDRLFIGKPLLEVSPEIEPSLYKIIQEVYHTGERFVGESYPISLDWENNGKPFIKYFNFVYEPFRNERGKVEGVIMFGYEVTSQVLARQVLEQNEARIRLILESIPHLSWTSLPETSINYFNKRWYAYTGLTEEQSIGQEWLSVLHPDDLPLVIERRTAGRSKGIPYEMENRYRRASDGTYRWHLARVVPIRDGQDKIVIWVGTATDIHDQKITQHALENTLKELHEKNFELDQFVYKTSHDLRAPLTTIMGLVTILKNEQNQATKAHYVDLIESRVHKLDTFIKSMLDYSRNTRTATTIENIDIEALLRECIGELEYMRHFERLHIDLHIGEQELYADVFRLKIIFSNLVSNAIKYQDFNKPESRLTIEVKPEGDQLIITFTDNGVGIDQAYQNRIFNMFFRASEQSEGSGLGLYIVRQAAGILNGSIDLKSEAGKGTQFTIILPKSAQR